MPTKFSQFNFGGATSPGDILVGLRGGVNTKFDAMSVPSTPWTTLIIGQPLFIQNGYFLANAAPATYMLPTVAAPGQLVEIVCITNILCTIAQNAGQQIQFGNLNTTLGAGGYIATTEIGDSITLICTVANTNFAVLGGPQGNWTIF
jgi:hypothetical protein